MKTITAAFMLLTLASTASARPLTDAETTAVDPMMSEMGQAMETGDVAVLTGGVPEELMQVIAKQGQLSVEDLQSNLENFTKELLTKVQFSDVKYDLASVDLMEGKDVDYGFAIMDFRVHANNQVQNTNAPVLLLHKHESDTWYTLRVEEAQLPLLKSLYSDLSEIEMPPVAQ